MSDNGWNLRLVAAATAVCTVFGLLLMVDSTSNRTALQTTEETTTTTVGTTSNPSLRVDTDTDAVVGETTADSALTGDTTDNQAPAEAEDAPAEAEPAAAAASGEVPRAAELHPTFESMRNVDVKFSRFADVPSAQLDVNALMEPTSAPDNGASPEGQFRLSCEYSHFSYDDPIIYPGEPGKSHLHMFFGNTETNAHTTLDTLVDRGGGTCQGFELNRSAYWIPALLDGRGNAVIPFSIVIYYKTKDTASVIPMPQGLEMIGGNDLHETFETSDQLHWSCGGSGSRYNMTNRIPDCGGDIINATIQFPNCWDGVNLGSGSPDYNAHLTWVNEQEPCPNSHPQRLPQISFLIYWPGTDSVEGWHLSSDQLDNFNASPGGSLHADWWGGWNDQTIELWTNNCLRANRNCSMGQTGTPMKLANTSKLEKYDGPTFIPVADEG